MGDVFKFSVLLEDGVARNAGVMSAAVRGLTGSLDRNRLALRENEAEQLRLQKIQHDFLSMGVGRSKSVDDNLNRLRLEHQTLAGDAKRLRAELAGETQAFSDLGRGLGRTAEQFATLSSFALTAGAAVVGVLAGIGAEAVKTSFEVVEFNRRTEAAFDALGAQGEGSGRKTLGFLNDLASKLPQSREELAQWTKQYEAMGITDLGQLRQQILATASAQAIMGDRGAEAYTRITERVNLAIEAHSGLKLAERSLKALYEAGVNVVDVASHMGVSVHQLEAGLKAGTVDAQAFGNALSTSLTEKGRKPLEVMGEDIGILGRKAKETFSHWFDDIDVSPITSVIQEIIHVGDAGEPAGAAMKKGVTAGVNELIKEIGIGIHEVEWFFLGLEIKALQAKPTIDGMRKAFDGFNEAIQLTGAALSHVHLEAFNPTSGYAGLNPAEILARDKGQATATAPAHSDGGMVMQPAPGEAFASVAPGEQIVPAGKSSGGVQIGSLTLHITAAEGVTNAQDVSVTGLATAIERLQLGVGR